MKACQNRGPKPTSQRQWDASKTKHTHTRIHAYIYIYIHQHIIHPRIFRPDHGLLGLRASEASLFFRSRSFCISSFASFSALSSYEGEPRWVLGVLGASLVQGFVFLEKGQRNHGWHLTSGPALVTRNLDCAISNVR